MAATDSNRIPLDHHSLGLMRRLWRDSVSGHRRRLAIAAGLMAVVAGATAITAWLIDPVINQLFVEKNGEMLVWISLAVLLTFVIRSVAAYFQENLIAYAGLRIVADTQVRLFRHLLHQDVATLQSDHSATLLSRFTYDINMMRYAVSDAMVAIGRDTLTIIFLVGVMFYQEWLLASIAFVVAPLSIYPIQRLSKRVRRITRESQEEMGALTTRLAQSFQGIRTVKAFRAEGLEEQRAAGLANRIFRLSLGLVIGLPKPARRPSPQSIRLLGSRLPPSSCMAGTVSSEAEPPPARSSPLSPL
jgi:ATP-binding cassette, subfamily B, bacterial MsbA